MAIVYLSGITSNDLVLMGIRLSGAETEQRDRTEKGGVGEYLRRERRLYSRSKLWAKD
jgi:hypothetical protein